MALQRVRFRVDFEDWCSVGEGKITLLEAVCRCGSISQAARDLGMSYRRAWLLIRSLNLSFDTTVVAAREGGNHGGGASLTRFGHERVRAFRELESELRTVTTRRMRTIAGPIMRSRRTRKVQALDVQRE